MSTPLRSTSEGDQSPECDFTSRAKKTTGWLLKFLSFFFIYTFLVVNRTSIVDANFIRLAIHLEHLTQTPTFIGAQTNERVLWRGSEEIADERFFEPVQWKKFSHVCTVPVKYDSRWSTNGSGTAFIVTGAQLHVKSNASTSVLHLRLLYSEVPSCIVGRSQWRRGPSDLSQKLSFFSAMSATLSGSIEGERQLLQQHGPAQVVVDSAVFPTGPPVPVAAQKLLKYVDTSQLCQGPQHSPGHWLVTGAKLDVEKGKIKLHVKFSLLTSVCWYLSSAVLWWQPYLTFFLLILKIITYCRIQLVKSNTSKVDHVLIINTWQTFKLRMDVIKSYTDTTNPSNIPLSL